MKTLLPWALAISTWASLGITSAQDAPRSSDSRPNLILIVTDDHPHDALGCAGHSVLETPNLDRIADRGVRFTHGFVTTPICAASRASLLTGQYERAHGFTFGQPPLSSEAVRSSYPVLLRGAGYRVGFVGKFGVRVEAQDRRTMFEEMFPGTYPYLPDDSKGDAAEGAAAPRHLTDRNTDRALEFLAREDARPFCLSLSYQAPHAEDHNPDQYVWPAACDGLYRDAVLPTPANSDAAFFAALPEFLRTGLNRERWAWRFDTPEKHRRMVLGYYRMLSGVDAGVGRILDALEERGLRENTLLVVIGDNGYFLGERGYAGKWTMHDRSIRVPLLVSAPGKGTVGGGRVVDDFALNIDIASTLLDWAGVDVPEAMQGRSLRPLIEGRGAPDRDAVFTEHLWDHPRIPRTEGLRTRDWKYIRYLDHPEYEELYDLRSDPEEGRNLAEDPEQALRIDRMRERCDGARDRAKK